MDLEIRHLRLMQAIAQEGTLTRAAGRLNLTQPALSHQLSDLETRLKTCLFRRTPRGMLLTAAGERLRLCANLVLEEMSRASLELNGSAIARGTIRLSTECYTCYHWLPSRIHCFHADFPEVEVRIVVEATHRAVDALADHEIDVAIASDPPRRKGLRSRRLFEDELVVLHSSEHPFSSKEFIRPADFSDQHLLTYAVPKSDLTILKEVLNPAGVTPARLTQVELTEAIIEMVKANLGIAVLARWAVAPHLGAALKALPLTRTGFRRTWCAVTRTERSEPEYQNRFVSLLSRNGAAF